MRQGYYGNRDITFTNVMRGQIIEKLLEPSQEFLDKKLNITSFHGGGCGCSGKPIVEMFRQHNKSIKIKRRLMDSEVALANRPEGFTLTFALYYSNGQQETYLIHLKIKNNE
jgi:hypothetical protein